ncbi:MAG: ribonuclease III [Sterolibacterium sp.]|nr:ribonuclease III [Sterolibacterium sp.]
MRGRRLERLEGALGHVFQRRDLLQQAVTHRSYGTPHNERIEFLGDSVLNCVIAARLFELFPALREGELSRLRANLVRQETLFVLAQQLKLGDYLRLGEGELKSGGFRRPSILADALEALFGAIFLEAGFETVRSVILALYASQFSAIDPRQAGKDPKTALQELLQGQGLALPEYALLETRGEAHAQEFEVECRVAALAICVRGTGSSRRSAEQEAAQQVCRLLEDPSRASASPRPLRRKKS